MARRESIELESAVSTRIVNNRIICAQLANSILVFAALISVRETGRPNLPTDFIKNASRSARRISRKCVHLCKVRWPCDVRMEHYCVTRIFRIETRVICCYLSR